MRRRRTFKWFVLTFAALLQISVLLVAMGLWLEANHLSIYGFILAGASIVSAYIWSLATGRFNDC